MTQPIARALLAVCLAFAGCRAAQLVPLPDQALALADPALCRIYVLRDEAHLRSEQRLQLVDDTGAIGSLVRDRYLCWERPPGRVVLAAQATTYRPEELEESLIAFEAEAGGIYWFEVGARSVRGRLRLVPIDPTRGRHRVETSEPADAR